MYPEPFNGQVEYPKVTPSCPYTACIAQHRPAISVSVNVVENHASGKVEKRSAGNLVDHRNPELTGARAVFSGGGCSDTGNYGQTIHCNVPLAPDPEVTVTFECKSGETC